MQEFGAAVEQLAHRALVGPPVAFIQTDAPHSFVEGVRDRELKQYLLMGGDRTPKWGLKSGLEIGGCSSGSRANSKAEGSDRGAC